MRYERIKRIADLIAASLAIVLLIPVFAITAIAIRLESPGPALFRQKRYGKDKQPFTVYKFRSMSTSAPSSIPTNDFHDARTYITRVGRIIRKLSIDELPQLFNVLYGKMSIVGPRPVVLNETNLLDLREQTNANSVKPGITGWAQVNGRDNLSNEEKARLDGQYAKNISFLLDAKCVLLTFWVVVSLRDNREGGRLYGSDKTTLDISEGM